MFTLFQVCKEAAIFWYNSVGNPPVSIEAAGQHHEAQAVYNLNKRDLLALCNASYTCKSPRTPKRSPKPLHDATNVAETRKRAKNDEGKIDTSKFISVSKHNQELRAKSRKIEKVEGMLATTQDELATTQTELATTHDDLVTAQRRLEVTQAEMESIRMANSQLELQLRSAREDLNQAREFQLRLAGGHQQQQVQQNSVPDYFRVLALCTLAYERKVQNPATPIRELLSKETVRREFMD